MQGIPSGLDSTWVANMGAGFTSSCLLEDSAIYNKNVYLPLYEKMNLSFNICRPENGRCFPTFFKWVNIIFFAGIIIVASFIWKWRIDWCFTVGCGIWYFSFLGFTFTFITKKKSHRCFALACKNICFSSLFSAGDVSRRGTSATQRQKFHTDDANQCLHNKSCSYGVPNINLFNFTCLLVDFAKVFCSSANKLQRNSNASSREDYMPQILTALLEIRHVYIWPLWPFVSCLSFVNNS